MRAMVRVEKNGLRVPLERLKGIVEGDLVEVELKKVYADEEVKKMLKFVVINE